MKKREISAIDSIYEILDRIKNIEDHYKMLNKQNALINNKLNRILSNNIDDARPASQRPVASVSSSALVEDHEPKGFVLGKIKVFSTMLTPSKSPITDVNVKIFDIKNTVIRNTLTDSKGYWEARLPPGRYRVTMDHDNFKTIERTLSLDSSISKFEVL